MEEKTVFTKIEVRQSGKQARDHFNYRSRVEPLMCKIHNSLEDDFTVIVWTTLMQCIIVTPLITAENNLRRQ